VTEVPTYLRTCKIKKKNQNTFECPPVRPTFN